VLCNKTQSASRRSKTEKRLFFVFFVFFFVFVFFVFFFFFFPKKRDFEEKRFLSLSLCYLRSQDDTENYIKRLLPKTFKSNPISFQNLLEVLSSS